MDIYGVSHVLLQIGEISCCSAFPLKIVAPACVLCQVSH